MKAKLGMERYIMYGQSRKFNLSSGSSKAEINTDGAPGHVAPSRTLRIKGGWALDRYSMHLSAILFNPSARVYNLRFLLLAAVAPAVYFRSGLGFVGVPVIFHHILGVFKWQMRGLAAIDLGLVTLEIASAVVSAFAMQTLSPYFIPQLVSLVLSAAFRSATICKSKGAIWKQRVEFLGCCSRVHPEYTPLTILLNRSLARPLVRGESRPIIFARAVVLSCIGLSVPAVGVYAVFILPLASQSNPTIVEKIPGAFNSPIGNSTIYLNGLTAASLPMDNIRVSARNTTDGDEMQCLLTSFDPAVVNPAPGQIMDYPSTGIRAQCPYSWVETFNITISIAITPDIGGLYVRAGQGYLPWEVSGDLSSDFWNHVHRVNPLLLLPGSRLIGVLSWTQRDIITQAQWGISTSSTTIFNSDVTSLQAYPATDSATTNIATLILLNPWPYATKWTQDAVDATPLSGVSTLGGFWTFVNGAFVLFFGANVIYFAFGRRPLSALGVVHVFQRRTLVRKWHEDFPAIHTEGGTPGSESAGIVAFIRERLVDLGEDPHAEPAESSDPEVGTTQELGALERGECNPQTHGTAYTEGESSPPRTLYSSDRRGTDSDPKPGRVLDEIPLLDIDLGSNKAVKE
ncbi:hypothetical protein B0H13DRAFT_2273065 [Mycena leptocephala]|nr:hypothetical protein B0H13DRAFT_2273065 [Mycena leptocephala]